jgi:CubicO group peptidase (beta-lactamase class C family)
MKPLKQKKVPSRAGLFFPALFLAASLLPMRGEQTSYPSDGGIAAKVQPFVDQNIIPGAVMVVADKDKILDVESVGYSDFNNKVPMDPHDLFLICSMTKTVTAVGLMQLVDQGKVNLDDPVEKYLPAFKGQMVLDPEDPNAKPHPPQHPITVREVMSHTAGLNKKHKEVNTSVTDEANEIAKAPLVWEPGSKYHYSEGPIIGGAIIEAVTGMKYCDYIKQNVLDPLGMSDSTFHPTEDQAQRLAICAKWDEATQKLANIHLNDPFINDPTRYAPVPRRVMYQTNAGEVGNYRNDYGRPDADMFSTAFDFAKFGQMLLNNGSYNGKQIVSAASVKEIGTVQTKDMYPGKIEGYGLCTFVQRNPSPYGPSPGSFGHRGARCTAFWVDPADGLVLVFMTQKWDIKPDQHNALDAAFFKTAIAKYGKNAAAGTASASTN